MSLTLCAPTLANAGVPARAASPETSPASCVVSHRPPTIAGVQNIERPFNFADSSATGMTVIHVDLDEHARVRRAEVEKPPATRPRSRSTAPGVRLPAKGRQVSEYGHRAARKRKRRAAV